MQGDSNIRRASRRLGPDSMPTEKLIAVSCPCGFPVWLPASEAQAFARGTAWVGAIALASLPLLWWLVEAGQVAS